ncbi:MAG: ABC transporter substrate-binding protein [Salinibacterium sp.]|nr:ABC transporter substrate-binding protein [Salinibacterium sp.]MBF0672966.1 ABC transporter substrate-binding protein [Salinibacterium sp.]
MHTRTRRQRRLAAVAGTALGAMLVTGCVASERGDNSGDDAGTFVFAASAEPVTLDPAFANDGETFRVARQIFEGLVGVEQGSADPAPLLAESWEPSDDGLSYTFELKEGVTFHDGTEFNAEAVCYNFDRWHNFEGIAQSPSASYYYNNLFKGFAGDEGAVYESCEAPSDNEAVVHLTQPWAGFIAALSLPSFSMQSPTALQEYGADEIGGTEEAPSISTYGSEHPTGTGPFTFSSWDAGSQVELTAYEDYWGEQGDVTDVIFRVIDDPNARRQALEAGTIDGYDLVSPSDTVALEEDGFQIMPRDPFTILYLGINQAVPELQDVRVRQAISMAIDKEQLVNQTLPEGTELATQFIPPVVSGYNEDVTTYDYDVDAAKALLAEAGIPEGWELTFNYPTNVSRPYMPNPEEIFTVVSTQLSAIGITVVPQANEWGEYLDIMQGSADHGIHLLGWTGDYNDTDNFVGVFFGQPSMEFGFDNPELFNALTEARGTATIEDQLPLYEDINQMIAEYIPAVPLAHPAPSLAFSERVASYPVSPVNDEVYNLVELND